MKQTACLAIVAVLLSGLCYGADDSADAVKKLSLDELWEQADVIVIVKKGKHKKVSNKTEIFFEEVLRGDPDLKSVLVKLASREKIDEESTGILFLKSVKDKEYCIILPSKKTLYNPKGEDLIINVLFSRLKQAKARIKKMKAVQRELMKNGGNNRTIAEIEQVIHNEHSKLRKLEMQLKVKDLEAEQKRKSEQKAED